MARRKPRRGRGALRRGSRIERAAEAGAELIREDLAAIARPEDHPDVVALVVQRDAMLKKNPIRPGTVYQVVADKMDRRIAAKIEEVRATMEAAADG